MFEQSFEQYFDRARATAGPPSEPLSHLNQLHNATSALGAGVVSAVAAGVDDGTGVAGEGDGLALAFDRVLFETGAGEAGVVTVSPAAGVGRPCLGRIESHPTNGHAPVEDGTSIEGKCLEQIQVLASFQ